MIKRILLLMALLAPAFAYGANSSHDFSVQILPAGSSGGGGGSGGGGSGGGGGSSSAPAAALAGCQTANGGGPSNGSCFSNQIVNMDFSGTTQSYVGPSGNFNASNVSSWLSASGCNPPYAAFYAVKAGAYLPGAAPCSDYTVISDPIDGQPSLRITMTPADLDTNSIGDVAMTTAIGGHSGVLIPAFSYYWSYQWHTDASTIANIQDAGTQVPGLYPFTSALNVGGLSGWSTSFNGSNIGTFEWDMTENHAPNINDDTDGLVGSSYGNFYDYSGGCYQWWSAAYEGGPHGGCTSINVPSYNPAASWTTVYGRITSDSAGNWASCMWVNGVLIPCLTNTLNQNTCGKTYSGGTSPCNSIIGAISGILLFGPSDMWANPGPQAVLKGPLNAYFRNLQVWTCPAAATAYSANSSTNVITISGSQPNPCAGVVLTTNP